MRYNIKDDDDDEVEDDDDDDDDDDEEELGTAALLGPAIADDPNDEGFDPEDEEDDEVDDDEVRCTQYDKTCLRKYHNLIIFPFGSFFCNKDDDEDVEEPSSKKLKSS